MLKTIVSHSGFAAVVVIALPLFGSLNVIADEPAISWEDVRGIRLEEFPEVPGANGRETGPDLHRFSISPTASLPDFGAMPELPTLAPIVLQPIQRVPVESIVRRSIDVPSFASQSDQQPFTSRVAKVVSPNGFQRSPAAVLQIVEIVARKENPPATSKPVVLEEKVALDHARLARRIEAYNYSVAGIENQLNSREQWSLEALESVVSQMEDVQDDRDLWSLYWNVLDRRRQRRLGEIRGIESAVEKLSQRIFETRVALDVDPQSVSRQRPSQAEKRLRELESQANRWLGSAN